MSYEIITGIVDQDMKGTNGRGTVFWFEIRERDQVLERHEYGLLEVLRKQFDPEAIKAPYIAANKRGEQLERQAKAEEKAAALAEREASVTEDPALISIIKEALANDQKSVAEFKSGKEKALNALVGKVIVACKMQGIPPDAFTINRLLKKELT